MCFNSGVFIIMNLAKKKLITEMMENWFVADHILFGGIPKSYLKKKSVYESYLKLKKNYIETLFEMYNLIGYTSKYIECPKSSQEVEINALKSVREAKKLASRTLVTESKYFAKILTESKKNSEVDVKKLQLSCMFESAFFDNQFKMARRVNNMNDPKFILLKNCLNECKKELINYSIKYMK